MIVVDYDVINVRKMLLEDEFSEKLTPKTNKLFLKKKNNNLKINKVKE